MSGFWVVVVLRVWWLWVWVCRRGFVVMVALVVADLVGCCLLWVSMVGGLKKEMGEIGAVSDLKKSFHLALRPLLTACSNQVISFFLFIN